MLRFPLRHLLALPLFLVLVLVHHTSAQQQAPDDGANAPTTRPAPPPPDPLVELRWSRPVTIDVRDQPVGDAMRRLAAATGCRIEVDWNALNLDPDTTVTLRLRAVSPAAAADYLLRAASTSVHAESRIDRDVVRIGAPDMAELAARVIPVRYNIRPLWLMMGRELEDKSSFCDAISTLIQSTIARDEWREAGGALGSIKFDDSQDAMTVTELPSRQAEVADLLDDLRTVLAGRPQPPEPGAALRRRLRQPMALHMQLVTLRQALDAWQRATGFNLFIDWRALSTAGVDFEKMISVNADTQPAGDVLQRIVSAGVNSETVKGAYDIEPTGVIVVSTTEYLTNVSTRLYDLRPLLRMRQLFNKSVEGKTVEQRIEDITRYIEMHVSPDSWRENGGQTGGYRELCGILIVSQTAENQERVAAVLKSIQNGTAKIDPDPDAAPHADPPPP